jgi:mono/diheme cytochrome c family protein
LKNITALIILVFALVAPLSASVYKGQKYFKKNCLSCHGKALAFVTAKRYDKWLEYLDENGEVMLKIHQNSPEAAPAMDYFNSEKYRESMEHFKDFFLEYAADTGNIPACE